jgi:hypothetical protein
MHSLYRDKRRRVEQWFNSWTVGNRNSRAPVNARRSKFLLVRNAGLGRFPIG